MAIRALIVDFVDVLLIQQDISELRAFETQRNLPENSVQEAASRYLDTVEASQFSEEVLWRDVAHQLDLDPQEWLAISKVYRPEFVLNDELVAFVRTLRPSYKTAILSNGSRDIKEVMTRVYRLDDVFDEIIISEEEGVAKPQAEMFRRALSRLAMKPEEAVFLDDNNIYIIMAQRFGLHGIQFRNTEQAIADIRAVLAEHAS